MSTPHYHPHASEFLYMITGSSLKVGFIQENGVRYVSNRPQPQPGFHLPRGFFPLEDTASDSGTTASTNSPWPRSPLQSSTSSLVLKQSVHRDEENEDEGSIIPSHINQPAVLLGLAISSLQLSR